MRRTSNKGTGKEARTNAARSAELDRTPDPAKRPVPAPHWDEPAPVPLVAEEAASTEVDEEAPATSEGHEAADENAPDDALGLYLRQMGAIPLLSREQELALAKRLEHKRNRYRRAALLNWRTLRKVVETFQRIQAGQLPIDPNIDVVMAAIYGAIAVTDTKLLATAALLRSQWADPASKYFYPINGADQQRGLGPMLGRYPGDVYDGDTDALVGDHPWAVSTANFAELYYRLAGYVTTAGTVPLDSLSAGFFGQIGVDASTAPAAAAAALQGAGDQMLQAVVFHSDHLELSEQFDATSGYEKSVSNLSWSYASFLSAIRARNAI